MIPTPEEIRERFLQAAIKRGGYTLHPLPIPEIEAFNAEIVRMRADGLVMGPDYAPNLTAKGRVAAGANPNILEEPDYGPTHVVRRGG